MVAFEGGDANRDKAYAFQRRFHSERDGEHLEPSERCPQETDGEALPRSSSEMSSRQET